VGQVRPASRFVRFTRMVTTPHTITVAAPFGCWYVQNTLDPMIVEGLLREVIVIGVDNTDERTYELTYRSGGGAGGYGGALSGGAPLCGGWTREARSDGQAPPPSPSRLSTILCLRSVDPQNGGGGGDLYLNFIEQTVCVSIGRRRARVRAGGPTEDPSHALCPGHAPGDYSAPHLGQAPARPQQHPMGHGRELPGR
jgi:hypothetical protein